MVLILGPALLHFPQPRKLIVESLSTTPLVNLPVVHPGEHGIQYLEIPWSSRRTRFRGALCDLTQRPWPFPPFPFFRKPGVTSIAASSITDY